MKKLVREFRTRFKNITLTRKLLFVYVVFAGFFFAVSIFAFQVSMNVFERKLYQNSIQELDYYVQNVRESIDGVENSSLEMLLDSKLQDILINMQELSPGTLEYNQLLTNIRWNLVSAKNVKSDVQTVYYIDPYGTRVESGATPWELSDEVIENFRTVIAKSNGEAVFYGPSRDCKYLLCGRKILNWTDTSLDNLGTLILVCDIESIIGENKKQLAAEHAELFVYTDDYMIYRDMDEENKFQFLPKAGEGQGYDVLRYRGERYFMCYFNSPEDGWMYVNFFPYSDVYGQIAWVRNVALLIFFVAFIMLLQLNHKIAGIITRPLESLIQSMKVAETGDFKGAMRVPMEEDRKDEVGILTQEFQLMLDTIDVLLRENYEKQLLLKDTKYKMLQAQINPHFLYNTLNAIHWMIRAEENEKAGRMIVDLGTLLRSSFNEDPHITVEEEVDVLKCYIGIQQCRYEDRAKFTVKLEGRPGKYVMPRMTLQPLVENAILHGADVMNTICCIDTTVTEEADSILFEIKDNGPGMEPRQLEAVRNFTVKPKGHGIGIKNIYERLSITYGTFEFRIDSKPKEGTVIRIRVPKQMTEE